MGGGPGERRRKPRFERSLGVGTGLSEGLGEVETAMDVDK